MPKITPFLMFDDQLEAALEFYTDTFPDVEVRHVARAGEDGPVRSAVFVLGGQAFMAFNGGPSFSFSDGISLYVDCEDQDEVDTYWNRFLDAGGTPLMCGWIRDPFGVSWQIIPRRLTELMGDEDPQKARAVVDAMLKMVRIDVAELERAYAGAG